MKATIRKFTAALCVLTLAFSFTAFGQHQVNVTNLDTTNLPAGVTYTGRIKSAVRWTDKSGDNIVIITETGVIASKTATSEDSRDAEIYAYLYIVGEDKTVLSWRVYDFVKDCPLDIQANFLKNTFQVTDLNKDGFAEVWLMYKMVCRGDVGPCDMKIIMYEGKQKYAMRGQNKVQIDENEFYGGEYTFDKAFTDGPAAFRDFAKKLWDKNIMQTWGE
jgi:hypothetical protein